MSDYSKETCEGCVYWSAKTIKCGHPDKTYEDRSQPYMFPWERCDEFAPSLQCRQVRALEKIAERLQIGVPTWVVDD